MSEERPERFNADLRQQPKIVRGKSLSRWLLARAYSYPEPCYAAGAIEVVAIVHGARDRQPW